jgi:hypothetical protein
VVGDETFDVFISYGHQDQAWVHTLAENLHRAGLQVFLDAWEITPGDVGRPPAGTRPAGLP